MSASKTENVSLTREILLSLVVGSSITFLLTVFRAFRILPELTATLLRPGPIVARRVRQNRIVSILSDAIVYGSLPFLVMRFRSLRREQDVPVPPVEKRRARREVAALPVFVYGCVKDQPFAEASETLNVSTSGGLIPLSVKPVLWQRLILTNARTEEDSPCRVVRSVENGNGKTLIGIEFLQTRMDFWQLQPSQPNTSKGPHS